jgi:hypothetical protein
MAAFSSQRMDVAFRNSREVVDAKLAVPSGGRSSARLEGRDWDESSLSNSSAILYLQRIASMRRKHEQLVRTSIRIKTRISQIQSQLRISSTQSRIAEPYVGLLRRKLEQTVLEIHTNRDAALRCCRGYQSSRIGSDIYQKYSGASASSRRPVARLTSNPPV